MMKVDEIHDEWFGSSIRASYSGGPHFFFFLLLSGMRQRIRTLQWAQNKLLYTYTASPHKEIACCVQDQHKKSLLLRTPEAIQAPEAQGRESSLTIQPKSIRRRLQGFAGTLHLMHPSLISFGFGLFPISSMFHFFFLFCSVISQKNHPL